MSKPKIYDAFLRIIIEKNDGHPGMTTSWKETLKAVCKINKKLNKVLPSGPSVKYVPYEIYRGYPTDSMIVRDVAATFVKMIDPEHVGVYQNISTHLNQLIGMGKSAEGGPLRKFEFSELMPFANMLSQTITMLNVIEQQLLSMKELMSAALILDKQVWENTPDWIKTEIAVLVAMNREAEKCAIALKTHGASSMNQIQNICDMIIDMSTMAKDISSIIKSRDDVRKEYPCLIMPSGAHILLNSLPTVLIFDNINGRADAQRIFGKYLPIVNEICKSLHLIVEISIALNGLGWVSCENVDGPKEYDLTEAKMSLRREVELEYNNCDFDQYNGDAEATDAQFINKIRLIMGVVTVAPPWKNPEQYDALIHTPHILRKLYDVIQNEPGDGWGHFIEVMASYPSISSEEGHPNDREEKL